MLKEKIIVTKMRIYKGVLSASTLLSTALLDAQNVLATTTGFSSNPASVTVSTNVDITKVLGGMIGWILNIFMGVGIVVAIIGAVQFFQAMKEEQPEGQSRAIKVFLSGCALASVRAIIAGLGLITK